jgi:enoyl-CoA hydratase/carnithine racemase
VLNAYNIAMRDAMWEALQAVRDDPDVRVAVLRGAGRAFCAGADLSEFGSAPSQVIARRVRWERDVWGLWSSLDKPFIAALHGHVIGSGLEMALLCDLRFAAENAVFRLPEVFLGLVPAAGGTQTLPRQVRLGLALDLLLTGRSMDAREALRRGLVNRIVDADRVQDQAMTAARHIASLDPLAVATLKQALRRGADLPLGEALRVERRLAEGLRLTSG